MFLKESKYHKKVIGVVILSFVVFITFTIGIIIMGKNNQIHLKKFIPRKLCRLTT